MVEGLRRPPLRSGLLSPSTKGQFPSVNPCLLLNSRLSPFVPAPTGYKFFAAPSLKTPSCHSPKMVVSVAAGLEGCARLETCQAAPNLLLAPRSGCAGSGVVAISLEHLEATLRLEQPATDLLSNQNCIGDMAIEPYGVKELRYIG